MVDIAMEQLALRASPEVRGILEDMRAGRRPNFLTGGRPGAGRSNPARRTALDELQRLHREETAHLLGVLAQEAVMDRWGAGGRANGLERAGRDPAAERRTRSRRGALLAAAGGEEALLLDSAVRCGAIAPQDLALAAARLVPAPAHHLNVASADFQDGDSDAAQAGALALLGRPLADRERAACLRLLALVARSRGQWEAALEHSCAAAGCLPEEPQGWIAALQAAVRAGSADEAGRIAARLAPQAAHVAASGPHLLRRAVGAGNERLSQPAAVALRRRLAERHGDWMEEVFRVA